MDDRNRLTLKVRLIGAAIYFCVKSICSLVQVLVSNGDVIRKARDLHGGFILASWHGRTFLPIYMLRGHSVRAVVSLSQDGDYAARVFQKLGWSPIRGSTSKGSVRVLLSAVRSLRKGQILAVTPDGPRGPARKVAAGVIYLASISGCPIIPLGVGVSHAKTLRSWDDYIIPYPFSTGMIVFGDPFYVARGVTGEEVEQKRKELEDQLNRLEAEATSLMAKYQSHRNYLLYNALLFALSPLAALYFLHKVCFGRRTRKGLRMQLGDYRPVAALTQGSNPGVKHSHNPSGALLTRQDHNHGPRIWLHAVSVGEAIAANTIVNELRHRFPDATVFLSTTTDTGQETARKLVTQADAFIYFPFDLPWAVRHALDAVQPDLFMMVETEIWPNLLHTAAQRQIPVLLVNGRISNRALINFDRMRWLWRWMASNITVFAMRSDTDANRIRRLQVEPFRVHVTGDVKLDQHIQLLDGESISLLRESLGLRQDEELLLAGSTHAGEEEILLDAWWHARIRYGGLRLLIAPRHLERIPEIEKLIHEKGFQSTRKSRIAVEGIGHDRGPVIILLDTLGELFRLYAAATVTFVGGSLIPRGGHNVLEPAFQGKPVLFGPHTDNFSDSVRLLLSNGIGFRVSSATDLTKQIERLLGSRDELFAIRQRAVDVLSRNQGAARRIADLAEELLRSKGETSYKLVAR